MTAPITRLFRRVIAPVLRRVAAWLLWFAWGPLFRAEIHSLKKIGERDRKRRAVADRAERDALPK